MVAMMKLLLVLLVVVVVVVVAEVRVTELICRLTRGADESAILVTTARK